MGVQDMFDAPLSEQRARTSIATDAIRRRVRQLEQRVESLIDLIAAKNTDAPVKASDNALSAQVVTPDSTAPTDAALHDSPREQLAQHWTKSAAFSAYDPIDAGVIDEQHAYRLVHDFQRDFVLAFPFVVVDVDGPTLRHQEPFLFHAILTVTAINTPCIQHTLSEQLRHQIGRMVEHSRKTLGTLQGLLVYAGW
jgi:hypothetical protein